MSFKLQTELSLEFLSFKGGYTGSSESAHINMPHFWKSHKAAQTILPGKQTGANMGLGGLIASNFQKVSMRCETK